MDLPASTNPAFGTPIEPRWARSDKDGIGTAMSADSRLWFTVAKGIVTEVYYPTIDLPQVRDLQFLTSDGETFFHDERRNFDNTHETLAPGVLGYRITNVARAGNGVPPYTIVKRVIAAPVSPCLLVHTTVDAPSELASKLKLYALLAPHLNGAGHDNSGWVVAMPSGKILVARSLAGGRETWLAMSASTPFLSCSCGVVGVTDGWQDLNGSAVPGNRPFVMDWAFDSAHNTNLALTAEIDLSKGRDFVLGVAFGETLNAAVQRVVGALGLPFGDLAAPAAAAYEHVRAFVAGWTQAQAGTIVPGPSVTGDDDTLYHLSRSILQAHEDKTYRGALIASLSFPWGEYRGDGDLGYHVVWTRDMCNSASALLATGDRDTPHRALTFLASVQRNDGGFYQNFHVNGFPHWTGLQLDEIAFPILLAAHLDRQGALQAFDPYPMVRRAAAALIVNGPMTQQERWEENEGYSPSTLAAVISALVCAASFAKRGGDAALADVFLDHADFLEAHLEAWTVADDGAALPGTRHFIRILPTGVKRDERRAGPLRVPALPAPDGNPNDPATTVEVKNGGGVLAARDLVDAGFLELVRYGIRAANDPLIVDSLKVIDSPATGIKVDFDASPERSGPCWHRYNQDGYGNKRDGSPFDGNRPGPVHAGPWPLLTGERGHYELAAGGSPTPYIRAMEHFAIGTGLISEQLWDLPDLPDRHMRYGYPTGAAMPLAWAHGEYIKLVRSATDGKVFDLIPEVAARYLGSDRRRSTLEIWNFYRQIDTIAASARLRIILASPFTLHWSDDSWASASEADASVAMPGLYFADLGPLQKPGQLTFTFRWAESGEWQNIDYVVKVA